jgi:hypothetical protein
MGTRLSLRPPFQEGNVDAQLRALPAPRDHTIVSDSRPHLSKTTDAHRSTDISLPYPLFATLRRFSQRAPPDNLPLFHYGFY